MASPADSPPIISHHHHHRLPFFCGVNLHLDGIADINVSDSEELLMRAESPMSAEALECNYNFRPSLGRRDTKVAETLAWRRPLVELNLRKRFDPNRPRSEPIELPYERL